MDKDFGTREEGVEVQAGDLEPGVYVDGLDFFPTSADAANDFYGSHSKALVVDEVKLEGSRALVRALDQEAGKYIERMFSVNKLVTTWGRI